MKINTSKSGERFLQRWMKGYEILGIENTPTADKRNEQYVVYKTAGNVDVAVLPKSSNEEDCSCFFGSLDYFADTITFDILSMPVKGRTYPDGRPLHPIWYLDHDDPMLAKWVETNKAIINKYINR